MPDKYTFSWYIPILVGLGFFSFWFPLTYGRERAQKIVNDQPIIIFLEFEIYEMMEN